MSAVLLDTHTWIWYANGSSEISKTTRQIINTATQQQKAYLAAISLWELNMLVVKKRIILDIPCLEWINQSLELAHLQIASLTPSIATDSCNLPGGFHDDPADRLIVATARVDRLTLLTRDKNILAYSRNKYVTAIKI